MLSLFLYIQSNRLVRDGNVHVLGMVPHTIHTTPSRKLNTNRGRLRPNLSTFNDEND